MTTHDQARDAAIREIAKRDLLIANLDAQMSGADFHEIAVWMAETALKAAYEAGRDAGRIDERRRRTPKRLICPACKRQIDVIPIP